MNFLCELRDLSLSARVRYRSSDCMLRGPVIDFVVFVVASVWSSLVALVAAWPQRGYYSAFACRRLFLAATHVQCLRRDVRQG